MGSHFIRCIFLLICISFFSSCQKDPVNWHSELKVLSKTNLRTLVIDENFQPLAGAKVEIWNDNYTTNDFGFLEVSNVWVVRGRVPLRISKAGFFDKFYTVIAQKENTTTKIMMNELQATTINAAEENTLDMQMASVTFPANSFIDKKGNSFNGNSTVLYKHFDPSNPYFQLQMPGGDFLGNNVEGEERLLFSYGAMTIELYDENGNELQLAQGQTATLRFKIPEDMTGDAPETIPLWYLNEENNQWQEEGFAVLEGDEYVGGVSHFSSWNCDDPVSPTSYIEGYVKDCEGSGLNDVFVSVGPLTIQTDETGYYYTNIATGYDFVVQVSGKINMGSDYINSEKIIVKAMEEEESKQLEVLTFCATKINGQIIGCNNQFAEATIIGFWEGGSFIQHTSTGLFQTMVPENIAIELYFLNKNIGVSKYELNIGEEDYELQEPVNLCENDCSYVQLKLNNKDVSFYGLTENILDGGIKLIGENYMDFIIYPGESGFQLGINGENAHIELNFSELTTINLNEYTVTELTEDFVRGTFDKTSLDISALYGSGEPFWNGSADDLYVNLELLNQLNQAIQDTIDSWNAYQSNPSPLTQAKHVVAVAEYYGIHNSFLMEAVLIWEILTGEWFPFQSLITYGYGEPTVTDNNEGDIYINLENNEIFQWTGSEWEKVLDKTVSISIMETEFCIPLN